MNAAPNIPFGRNAGGHAGDQVTAQNGAAGWHVASVNQSSGHVVFARGVKGGSSSADQRVQPVKGSYIDAQVIAAIKAQEGTDRFDRSKLMRLINPLTTVARPDSPAPARA